MTRILAAVLLSGTLVVGGARAHDGHDHPVGMRVWKDAEGLFEIEAAFVAAKDGKVTLHKHDGKVVTLPLDKFSAADRQFVEDKLAALAALNGAKQAGAKLPETREELVAKPFAAFPHLAKTRADDQFLFVESRGFPDHRMMVGITAWQQQVPLPQPYFGANAWRIPLHPRMAAKPVSAKSALFRGAIALAANGVPIFNALNNRGEDAYRAGELDEFGGHCGRADDYHYHIGPVHLEKVVGKGNPIGYALDGFPLHGYADAEGKVPNDLDAFNGRMEKDGYRYYSTPKYPYINGGLRGEVTVRGDQIDPQPRANPLRPAGEPLRGAKIAGFTRDDEKKHCELTYTLRGAEQRIAYTIQPNGAVAFVLEDGTKETYRPRPGGDRPDGPKGKGRDDEPGQKKGKGNGGQKKGKDRPPPPEDDRPDADAPPAVMLTPRRTGRMALSSSAVKSGDPLPREFTGDGAGSTPPLAWRGAPAETRSFALVMDHQARDGMKCYWLLWDIPAETARLPKDAEGIGKNGLTWKPGEDYIPPHSQGPGTKTYTLTVYALSAAPTFPAGTEVDRNALLTAIKGSILDSAEMKVTYSRPAGAEDEPDRPKGKGKGGRKPKEDQP